ncbi:hypothetical protein ES332_D05G180600v1 [Gossypium tomentosum]|uniref:Uncharacterized protein n=1 Tax=Gossypium tomentosum TaxID=34277 RepID=A0A5D2KWZ8_GOSTO|nr:hypothetical protein ES332_D05G180600v1 [Gossypium tomentosum]
MEIQGILLLIESLILGIGIQLYFGVLEHYQKAFEWVCHPHYLIYNFIM